MFKQNSVFLLSCLKFSVKKYFVYLSYFVNEIIGSVLLPLIINSIFWGYMISQNPSNYTISEMIIYLIYSNITFLIINVDCANIIAKDIKSYRLGQRLLYPVAYNYKIVIESLMQILIRFIVIYLPICLVLSFFQQTLITGTSILMLLISLGLGLLMNLLVSILIGMSSFYFTEIWGINAIKSFMFFAFSGAFFPIDILSNELQSILYLTPFPYVSFIPSKLISQSTFVFNTHYFLVPVFWIVVILIMVVLLWKKGLRKYEACGA